MASSVADAIHKKKDDAFQAALREAEGAAREQLQLRDSLVRVLGEEARQQAAAWTASPEPEPEPEPQPEPEPEP